MTATVADPSRNARLLGPIRVGLRSDLHVTRQNTRSGPRYLLHDPLTFQNHALSVQDYRILCAIVAERTLAENFQALVQKGVLDDDDEDRQGYYRFILWLHGAGILHLPLSSGDAHFERHRKRRAARRRGLHQLLLSARIPLLAPDAFLRRTLPWFGWLFSMRGFAAWLALAAAVLWSCFDRLGDFAAQSTDLLALRNLPLLWVALVLLKVVHEFGHAYACRRFGGAVPEMGIVLILLTPCAYVDANASWTFARRRHRIVVALAGMYVESFVAGFAALLWAGTQPGFVHDVAYNLVVLASAVTVLFNINPLMRYDGYYLFSDLLGVFNLQQRAAGYLGAWFERLALGTPRPAHGYPRSECWLYLLYGPLGFAYRIGLAFGITTLVMLKWPGAGLFLGAAFGWSLLARPAVRFLRWLWCHGESAAARTRGRLVAIGLAVPAPLVLAFAPVSWSVVAPGILDPGTRESVRAPNSGFVSDLAVRDGTRVLPDDPLCQLRNPEMEFRLVRMRGEYDAEKVGLDTVELQDPTAAAMHRTRLSYLKTGLEELDRRFTGMNLVAHTAGIVTNPAGKALEGRFLQQGEELFQIQSEHRYLRIVLSEHAVSRARLEVGGIAEVRWTCAPDIAVRATVREIRRAASRYEIPIALTTLGGGDVYATPRIGTGAMAEEPFLHVWLEVDKVPLEAQGTGLTAHVRLPARVEMLGSWARRRLLSFWNSWLMS